MDQDRIKMTGGQPISTCGDFFCFCAVPTERAKIMTAAWAERRVFHPSKQGPLSPRGFALTVGKPSRHVPFGALRVASPWLPTKPGRNGSTPWVRFLAALLFVHPHCTLRRHRWIDFPSAALCAEPTCEVQRGQPKSQNPEVGQTLPENSAPSFNHESLGPWGAGRERELALAFLALPPPPLPPPSEPNEYVQILWLRVKQAACPT